MCSHVLSEESSGDDDHSSLRVPIPHGIITSSSSRTFSHNKIQSIPSVSIRPINSRQVLNNAFNLFLEMIIYLMNAMYMATVFDVDELFLPIKKHLDNNSSSSHSSPKRNATTSSELPFERLTQSVSSLLSPPTSPKKTSTTQNRCSFSDLFSQQPKSPYSNLIFLNAHYEQMLMELKQTNSTSTTTSLSITSTTTSNNNNNLKPTTTTMVMERRQSVVCGYSDITIPTIQIECAPVETFEESTSNLSENSSKFEHSQTRRRSNSFFPLQQTLTTNGTNADQHENPIILVIPPPSLTVPSNNNNLSNRLSVTPMRKNSLNNLTKPNFPQPSICKFASLQTK